jgi:hypothetical protein
MLIDERSEFAEAVTRPEVLGRQQLGDVIDAGAGSHTSMGDVFLVLRIRETFASAGSAAVTFELASDSTPTIATDGTASVHVSLGPLPVASLTAGAQFVVALPSGPYEQYLGLLANVETDTFSAGKVDAFLTLAPAKWTAYPRTA